MHCLVCDCSPLEDEALFSRAYAAVSESRRAKADSFSYGNGRRSSLTAGLFLRLIENSFGEIAENADGKPLCEGIEFNFSHSGHYVAFAFSDSPVGVDIERIGRGIDAAKRVMTASEYVSLSDIVDAEEREEIFCRMWTAKESYMKCLGLGIRLPPDSFRVLHGRDVRCPSNDFSIVEIDAPKGYCLSVCSADAEVSYKVITVEDILDAQTLGDLF